MVPKRVPTNPPHQGQQQDKQNSYCLCLLPYHRSSLIGGFCAPKPKQRSVPHKTSYGNAKETSYATPKNCCSASISLSVLGGEGPSLAEAPSADEGGAEEEEASKTALHCRTASATSSALVMAEITAMLSAPASNTCFAIVHFMHAARYASKRATKGTLLVLKIGAEIASIAVPFQSARKYWSGLKLHFESTRQALHVISTERRRRERELHRFLREIWNRYVTILVISIKLIERWT